MQAVDNTLPFADQVVFPSEVGNISCLMPSLTHVKIHKILRSEDSISPLRLSFILLFFPQSVRLVIHPAALPVFPRRKCQSSCTHHVTLGDRVNKPAVFQVL